MGGADTRFGAPHSPQIASMRVSPRLMVRDLALHGLFDEALGLGAHVLFRHQGLLSFGPDYALHAIADFGNDSAAWLLGGSLLAGSQRSWNIAAQFRLICERR